LIEYQLQSLNGCFGRDGGWGLAVGEVKSVGKERHETQANDKHLRGNKSPNLDILLRCSLAIYLLLQNASTHCGMVKFVDFLKCRCSVECSGGSILAAGLVYMENKR
jgi:hypothetical protein